MIKISRNVMQHLERVCHFFYDYYALFYCFIFALLEINKSLLRKMSVVRFRLPHDGLLMVHI